MEPSGPKTAAATVHWLRDPADDTTCGPLACDVDELLADVVVALGFAIGEAALVGPVRSVRAVETAAVVLVGSSGAADEGPAIEVVVPALETPVDPGSLIRVWGQIEVTDRFALRLQATRWELIGERRRG